MMRRKLVGVGTAAVLASSLSLLPAVAASAAPAPAAAPVAAAKPMATSLPVSGTFADGTVFSGTISDLTARNVNGVLTLTGTITGNRPGGGTFTDTFSAPIENLQAPQTRQAAAGGAQVLQAPPAGCAILNLDLGPLDLNLLGLVINLEPIVLDITAVPGAGNLLGNLLCAVAGLLDNSGGGVLNGVAALLNRILSLLG